jgi:hypothetical protein
LTITELIERAHQRTGRKNEGKEIDLRGMVISALQDLCRENRWPFRRMRGTFTSVAGTKTYDLTSATYGDMDDLEEVIAVYYVNGTTVYKVGPSAQSDDMVSDLIATDSGDPSRYTLEPGTEGTIRFDKCSSVRTFYVYYWAIPNPSIEDTDDTIALLPSKYHYVLLQYVTAMFWALLPGEGISGPNATAAYNLYLRQLDLMKRKSAFSTQETRSFKSTEAAVRAT